MWVGTYPGFFSYFEKNWMAEKWLPLWVPWCRAALSTFHINTTNAAELLFNVINSVLLLGRRATNFVSVLLKLVGQPGNIHSVEDSYVNQILSECWDVRNGDAPARQIHLERERQKLLLVWTRCDGHGDSVEVMNLALDILRVMSGTEACSYMPLPATVGE